MHVVACVLDVNFAQLGACDNIQRKVNRNEIDIIHKYRKISKEIL